ncbi:AcrR family transcriptional regulator [Bacillus pakistanensis]|uniref:AcrR family transcriptional regulator n=1 Tax=Rossellomorea pakistanensis TaxID=992288 RepID=A0ABS2NJU4_9BACI|nr:TetR/AcrR family transcriptional regulator [Bacillus pakistanensis]MBM7588137.1 AcrR family transcriptional regulator [Bacillus pakistanensis]
MAGLREEKKLQTQARIMESAKKVFMEKGFQKASMAEIAKNAEVGAGTIYNYFPSKGSLLLIIFSKEFEQMQKYNAAKLTEPSDGDLVDMIIEVLKQLTSFFNHYSKAFWREIFHVMTEEVEESIDLRRKLFGLDEDMMIWFKELINKHSECFLIPIHPEDAAYALYSITITDTMLYIYDENMTYEKFLEQITRHVTFLFAGKLK